MTPFTKDAMVENGDAEKLWIEPKCVFYKQYRQILPTLGFKETIVHYLIRSTVFLCVLGRVFT